MSYLESQALSSLRASGSAQYSPALQAWKEKGGKVVGLMYAYVPEEIFDAAGIVPYRMRAFNSTSNALANARFKDVNCTLVRHFYDEMKRGGFSFCDGFVSANACDHERRLYDNVVATIDVPFAKLINFPKKKGEAQADFYAFGLRDLLSAIETHFQTQVSEDDLRASINKYNKARALQRELYEMRKSEKPPLSGTDMLAVMLAQSAMPIDDYVELLKQLIVDCKSAPGIGEYSMRAFVYGGEIDSLPLMEAIESTGALVVGDYLGIGYRSCLHDVPDTGDALRDLATHAIMLRPEPRLWGTMNERQQLVERLAKECGADGVILPAITFCDHWTWEQYNFELYAKEAGIPLLNLDMEYLLNATGQMKTRVQAFAEANGRI